MNPTPTPDIVSVVIHTPELLGVVIGMALGAIVVISFIVWLYRALKDDR
jgi:hypothetical protein